jgi:hypothetical protein
MMIKDLSVSKEIDGQAVRGGFQDTTQQNNSGSAYAFSANSGIGSTAVALVAPNQLNFNAPSFTNQPVAVGIAGNALAI